ncbi:hypothetical protein E2C01_102655 [Portunus trituberculatus]|uniref:Uncharacterized protein n=1 Tax=Portunus trituberculatus TaxID=210409 RepID=A0A5B7KPN0_PORTR|nr:hypothetical protein [Portunus trituberculatus]
MWARHRWR